MSQFLCIEVMDLEGTMVNVGRSICTYEETVVVDVVIAAIDMRKECDILFLAFPFHVKEISRHNIEYGRIKSDEILEFLRANSEVAKLFNNINLGTK